MSAPEDRFFIKDKPSGNPSKMHVKNHSYDQNFLKEINDKSVSILDSNGKN